jgi:hypothetical protein
MTSPADHSGSHFLQLSIPTRDPTYYISDGNTVLLVESTLFKVTTVLTLRPINLPDYYQVHRSRLIRDKSLFEAMFTLPPSSSSSPSTPSPSANHTTTPEGDADDHPIRLPDRADEIRALLWALYALPPELAAGSADASLLARLAHAAHKYQFRALEGWALQQLHAHYARPGALDDGELEQLTDLAALCARSDLLDACVARWKRAVFEGADVARAVGVAERHGLRPLLGLAYHAMLLQGRDVWDADPGLSRAQRVRLLSGHYSLGALWAALPASPPPLTHSARCTAPARCAKAWAALWARTLELGAGVLTHAYPDALGKLVMAE